MSRCKSRIRFGMNLLPVRCRLSKHDDNEIAHTGHKAWWRFGIHYTSTTWGDVNGRVLGERYHLPKSPKIVVLCGSTRFMHVFREAGWVETLKGNIVLSVGVSKHLPPDHGGESLGQGTVEMLDELHWRKIDLADEVLVLNVDGYIGYSTGREIEYAKSIGKPIRYLEATEGE